eukprot:TRINITY_DN37191_c0_g1_i1.p1 TRINITY_DN37191_c0_g1~~TRINITY_DN37191_c0_g1_i1.p1  ORF type:complete len:167 (+),score=25.96 TRINITY_DN37191_c0_g1_i1:54-554(+)
MADYLIGAPWSPPSSWHGARNFRRLNSSLANVDEDDDGGINIIGITLLAMALCTSLGAAATIWKLQQEGVDSISTVRRLAACPSLLAIPVTLLVVLSVGKWAAVVVGSLAMLCGCWIFKDLSLVAHGLLMDCGEERLVLVIAAGTLGLGPLLIGAVLLLVKGVESL